MSTTVRLTAVVVLLAFSVACGGTGPTSPSGTSQPPPPPAATPRQPIDFAPLSGPSRTFIFGGELSYHVRDFTRNSRFILYDNGAFVLQYPLSSLGNGTYRGQYQDDNGVIVFMFNWGGQGSVFSPWDATGTLKGDSLTVQYTQGMQHADFENAVYVVRP